MDPFRARKSHESDRKVPVAPLGPAVHDSLVTLLSVGRAVGEQRGDGAVDRAAAR